MVSAQADDMKKEKAEYGYTLCPRFSAGYGDPAIVADRESNRVLMLCVCGYQVFFYSTREIPNQVARLYSEDGATNKYWAASGAKLGDDIVISAKRAEFGGSAQAGSARFVELSSPGTLVHHSMVLLKVRTLRL